MIPKSGPVNGAITGILLTSLILLLYILIMMLKYFQGKQISLLLGQVRVKEDTSTNTVQRYNYGPELVFLCFSNWVESVAFILK
jgi:hypothetical protein